MRAGPLDIEVVGIGGDPPREPHGYGVGLVADVGLDEAIAHLRGMGFPTSPAVLVRAGVGVEQRAWRASVDAGPAVAEVHLGTGGYRGPWERLPLNGSVRLDLDDVGPVGIRRVVLRGAGEPFALGGVAFEHTP